MKIARKNIRSTSWTVLISAVPTHADRDTISQNPSNGMTTEGPKAENNKMIPMESEKYGARPQNILDASSYQQIYNNNSNNFNGSGVLNSNTDNAVRYPEVAAGSL